MPMGQVNCVMTFEKVSKKKLSAYICNLTNRGSLQMSFFCVKQACIHFRFKHVNLDV